MIKRIQIPLLLIVLLVLTACGGKQESAAETVLDTAVPPTAAPSPTPTTPPTPLAIIFAPPESDASTLAAIQPIVEQAAAQAGLVVEVHQTLDPATLPAGLQLVVALPPAANLQELIAAAPNAQFIAMAVPGLAAVPNLTEITGGGQRAANTGFLAGYTSALVTDDYRVGVIFSFSQPAYGQSFVTGVSFYCGLCQQQYPPFFEYPLTWQISADAAPGEWQVVADQLIASSVKTVFIAPDINAPALYEYLAQNGIMMISSNTPPDSVSAYLLGTINLDTTSALSQIIPQVLSNGGQGQIPTAMSIMAGGAGILGPGHIRNINEIAAHLEAGNIYPGAQ